MASVTVNQPSLIRGIAGKTGIILLAIILNGLIFLSLPLMISKDRMADNNGASFENIDFVRVKKPTPPVKKKKPPEKIHKPIPKKTVMKNTKATPRPRPQPRMLSFELNSRLPISAITMPEPKFTMEKVSFGIKNYFDVGELDQPLAPISRAQPVPPMRARSKGIQGRVSAKFIINEQGFVENLEITEEDPPNVFTSATIRAISSWRFKPPTVDGEPVKVKMTQTIKFEFN